MGLDQINPITPIAPIKFDDKLEQYSNFLKDQYLQSEIAKSKREEDDSTAFNNAGKVTGAVNADGSFNTGVMGNALAQGGQAKQLPGFLKGQSDIAKSNAEAGASTSKAAKDDADTLHQKMQNYADAFANMPRNDPHAGQAVYYSKLLAMSRDPQIVKLHGSASPEDFIKSGLQDSFQAGQSPQAWQAFADKQVFGAQKAADLLKEVKVLPIKRGDKTTVVMTNPTDANPSLNELGTYSVLPAKGQTININNLPGPAAETSFAKAQGTSQSDALTALSGIATSAPQGIAKIDQALDIIKGGNFITGIGADKKLAYYKFLKAGGLTTDKQNQMIDNTEQLNKYLAGNTLDQTAAFNKAGLGARTSVQELKMLSDATARSGMEPEAMSTVLLKQRKDLQDAIPRFNERRGEFSQAGVSPALKALASHDIALAPDSPYEKEVNPKTGQPYDDPTSANIARLKAHPEEAAIFASHYGNHNLLKYGGH